MTRGTVIASVILMLGAPIGANAQDLKGYVAAYGGLSMLQDNTIEVIDYVGGPVAQTFFLDYDRGVAFGFMAGRQLSNNFRLGLEIAHRTGALETLTSPGNIIPETYEFKTSATALLGEVFFDLPGQHGYVPYVGVGAGIGRVKTSGALIPDDSGFHYGEVGQSGLAYIFHAGLSKPVSATLDLTFGYSYLQVTGIDEVISTEGWADKLGKDFGAHALALGVTMKF
jgi:opacity protein-like surface antigen